MEAHRDLLIWTVKKYKELQPKGIADIEVMESEQGSSKNESLSTGEVEKAEKEQRAKLAAERRAKIMEQMKCAQKNFMSTNAELFEKDSKPLDDKHGSMEWQDIVGDDCSQNKSVVCLGPQRNQEITDDQMSSCILCSEDAIINNAGSCMVYSAFVQKSNVIAHANDLIPPPHTSSCGHIMHAICWNKYFENEEAKETRRPNRARLPGIFVIDKKEFLCPLCRCLSNAVLPITPALARYAATTDELPEISESTNQFNENIEAIDFVSWVGVMKKYTWSLQQIQNLTEFIEAGQDITSKLPDLEEVVQEFSLMEPFVKLSKPVDRNILSTELKTYIQLFIESVKRVAPFPYAYEDCEPFLVTWLSCAYTVESLEMYLRALNKPLKGQMSIRHTSCLSGLIRNCSLLAVCTTDKIAAKLTIHLRCLLDTVFNDTESSVVEWNVFKMLVSLIFSLSSVLYSKTSQACVPNGSLLEYYLLKLMFSVNLAKIAILRKTEDNCEMDVDNVIDENDQSDGQTGQELNIESNLVKYYKNFNLYVKDTDIATQSLNKKQYNLLLDDMKEQSRIFLRNSCLLFHFMTDIELPEQFANVNGDTFDKMCEYLGLSADIESYFNCDVMYDFMTVLGNNKQIDQHKLSDNAAIVQCVSIVKNLVTLPDDYSDLINSVSMFTCPNNDRDDTRNPTMCLMCGEILCSMTYCCQKEIDKKLVGACTYHTNNCGAGAGIFLRIRDCEILLLGMNKGCFMSAPYLDEYGETDQGLRRGNPLHLCEERLNKLHMLWLSHGLHEEIARMSEGTNSLILTQWQNM